MVGSMNNDKISVAVIGGGNIARTVHLPVFAAHKQIEIIAICDNKREAAEAIAAEYKIQHVYTDYQKLLQETKPQSVCICVPNAMHMPIASAALESGSHVLCEKPPAINYAEALQMDEAATRAGRILCYNFGHRYRGETDSIRAIIEQERLGQIYSGKVRATRRRAVPGWGVFTNKALQGGGALIDIGVHMLDTALYLLNYPSVRYVSANSFNFIGRQGGEGVFGPWDGEKFTVEDGLFGQIVFENGSCLQLETSFALHSSQKKTTCMNLELYGDKAGVELEPCMLHRSKGGVQIDESIPFVSVNHSQEATADFIEAMLTGREHRAASKTVLPTQYLIDMLYSSAESGRPVDKLRRQ